jgi:hypothetical protein
MFAMFAADPQRIGELFLGFGMILLACFPLILLIWLVDAITKIRNATVRTAEATEEASRLLSCITTVSSRIEETNRLLSLRVKKPTTAAVDQPPPVRKSQRQPKHPLMDSWPGEAK